MSPVRLAVQTLLAILAMVIGTGAQLFLPAWTLDYWQAWVFIVLVVGCSNAIGVYLALESLEEGLTGWTGAGASVGRARP